MIKNAAELYQYLEQHDLLKEKPPMWWPEYGSFEVIVGAILTQNSQWTRVEVSLQNLRTEKVLSLEGLCTISVEKLQELITPSGLFKSKADYIQGLSLAIRESFGSFETFCSEVQREWLLKQKGVGPETADSILCYACKREEMVVDAYTARLLRAFGYEFDTYDDLKEWCVSDLCTHVSEKSCAEVYAFFHGMIVEFVKANSKGKKVILEGIK